MISLFSASMTAGKAARGGKVQATPGRNPGIMLCCGCVEGLDFGLYSSGRQSIDKWNDVCASPLWDAHFVNGSCLSAQPGTSRI